MAGPAARIGPALALCVLGCADSRTAPPDAAAQPVDAGAPCPLAQEFAAFEAPSAAQVLEHEARFHDDRLRAMFGVFASGEFAVYRGSISVTDDYELLGADFDSDDAIAWIQPIVDFRGQVWRLVVVDTTDGAYVTLETVEAEPGTVYVTPALACPAGSFAGATCTDCPLVLDPFPAQLALAADAHGALPGGAPEYSVRVDGELTRVDPAELTGQDLLRLWACRGSGEQVPSTDDFESGRDGWHAGSTGTYGGTVPVPERCGYYHECTVTIDYGLEYFLSEVDPTIHRISVLDVSADRSSLCCTRYIEVGAGLHRETACPFATEADGG